MRFADDFVALALEWSPELSEYIESKLEGKFQLEINRDKTRVVNLREKGASLDFLGYTFRQDRDLKGRDKRYLNVFPSKRAVQRERDKLHEMTNSHQCFKPIPDLIDELNRHLTGWANYFSFGSATGVHWVIDWSCVADSSDICKGAVKDPSIRRRECRGIGTSKRSDW